VKTANALYIEVKQFLLAAWTCLHRILHPLFI